MIFKTKAQPERQKTWLPHIYKKNHPDIPKNVTSMYDLGFLGVEKDFPEQRSSPPIKQEKGSELTVHEKEYNRNHSTKKIVIEHAIYRLKKYMIMNDVVRTRLKRYDISISICFLNHP